MHARRKAQDGTVAAAMDEHDRQLNRTGRGFAEPQKAFDLLSLFGGDIANAKDGLQAQLSSPSSIAVASKRREALRVLRRRSASIVPSMRTDTEIRSVAAAGIVGLICSRTPSNICSGNVRCSGPARKIVVTISSNEVVNAKMAPAITPGAMSGKTTLRNALSGCAPRLNAARHRAESNP